MVGVIGDAPAGSAQQPSRAAQPEIRTDVIAARGTSTEVGVGAVAPAGEYLRLGGDLAFGVAAGDGRPTSAAGRADAYARIHLDPFAEHRWAPYLVGGGSYLVDGRRRGRLALLAVLGVEGPAARPLVPALEIGFGDGVRVGLALRKGRGAGIRG